MVGVFIIIHHTCYHSLHFDVWYVWLYCYVMSEWLQNDSTCETSERSWEWDVQQQSLSRYTSVKCSSKKCGGCCFPVMKNAVLKCCAIMCFFCGYYTIYTTKKTTELPRFIWPMSHNHSSKKEWCWTLVDWFIDLVNWLIDRWINSLIDWYQPLHRQDCGEWQVSGGERDADQGWEITTEFMAQCPLHMFKHKGIIA